MDLRSGKTSKWDKSRKPSGDIVISEVTKEPVVVGSESVGSEIMLNTSGDISPSGASSHAMLPTGEKILSSVLSSVLESQPNIGDAIKDIQANIKIMNLVLLSFNTRMDTVEIFHRPSQLTAEPVDSIGESIERIVTHENICRTSNSQSNLFHLLTGQDCICNSSSSSSDSDISIRQHAEDSNKLQKQRIIH
jgi:hypothetical protein